MGQGETRREERCFLSTGTQEHAGASPREEKQSNVASFQRVLKNRHFLLLWLAQLISLTALNAANYGVIVIVNEVTHSVFMAGLAIIAFTLPAVPFSAVAGVIVDRMNKRLVLWISNLLRMAAMLLLVVCLLTARSNLWPLYIITFITSLIGQFFIPAEGSSIPLLVGERDLMPALSLFNISITVSQALGFLVLGQLVSTIFPTFSLPLGSHGVQIEPTDSLFILVALAYLVCVALILLIPTRAFREAHIQRHERAGAHVDVGNALSTLWNDMADGWHIVREDRLLFYSVIQLSVVGIVMLLIGELAGAFVQNVLHRPVSQMAFILAPAAIGLVGASALMPRISERFGKVRLATIGFVVLAIGFFALIASSWIASWLNPKHGAESPILFWTVIIIVFLLGIAMAVVNIPTQTMMQERAPEQGRARVLAFQFMLYNAGSIPVLLFAGAIAQLIGFNEIVICISVGLLLFDWWGAWYLRRQRRQEQQKQQILADNNNAKDVIENRQDVERSAS